MRDELEVLRQRAQKLESICALGQLVSSSLHMETVVDRAMAAAEDIAGAESSSVWEVDPTAQELFFHFARGGVDERMKDVRIPLGEGIVGHAVAERTPILVPDVEEDPRWVAAVDQVSGFRTRSIVCVPLVVEDRAVGAIQLLNKRGGGAFTDEDLQWLTFLAGQVAIAIDNARYHASQLGLERIQRDLHIARSIHGSIFPREIPQPAGYRIAGRTEACYEIGGDYYDVVELGPRRLLVMADVAGKGISSALVASSFRAALRSIAVVEPSVPLPLLVRGLNLQRHQDGRHARARHVTAFLGSLDPERHLVTALSAGHNPALLVARDGSVREVGATTLPLGLRAAVDEQVVTFPMEPGATLVLYTDGITEASDGERDFGVDGLGRFVAARRDARPAELLDELWREVARYTRGAPAEDDRTAMVIRRLE